MPMLDRMLKWLFWAALVFAYVAAVVPQVDAPAFSSSDKVEHMVAFLTLALLAALGWRRARLAWIGVGLAGFGAFIEFSQMIPALHRDADVKDWIADAIAIVVGLAIAAIMRPLVNRLAGQGR
jgi:VanZ family protein